MSAKAAALIAEVFARRGGELVDPPTLMPAALPLELSGEAVRARLCVFQNGAGVEQALRPDLTLPVALAEVEARASAIRTQETVVRYAARAFRLPADASQPLEFVQVGFERFDAPSTPEIDADVFALVCEAAKSAGAIAGPAWFGDLAVLPAFIDALDLQPSAGDALKRAFRQAGGVRALLDGRGADARKGLAARLKGASWDEADAVVRDVLAVSGVQMIGARTVEEVVERLLAQAGDVEAGGVSDDARMILDAVMAVEAAPRAAVDALCAIAKDAGLSCVEPALDALATRFDAMAAAAPDVLENGRFGAPFGRRFNYYDGFVFELFEPGSSRTSPFAAGGRYDRLLYRLSGGDVDASAIGGVVRPDRIAGAAT